MPVPEQELTLKALVAGELPPEVVFDPVTDNDSTGSCLGCAYSVLGGAAVLVGLYVAQVRAEWALADRFLTGAGLWGQLLVFVLVALTLFALVESCLAKEMLVLVTGSRRLELRLRRFGKQTPVQAWEAEAIGGFELDLSEIDGEAPCSLYVRLEGEEPRRLLEPTYPRSFVQQVASRLNEWLRESHRGDTP